MPMLCRKLPTAPMAGKTQVKIDVVSLSSAVVLFPSSFAKGFRLRCHFTWGRTLTVHIETMPLVRCAKRGRKDGLRRWRRDEKVRCAVLLGGVPD